MKELNENILNHEITLIITSPNSKTLSIINLLNELSIKDNYKTILFSFHIRSSYYLQKLISFLSGIDTNLIIKYFYPCAMISKNNKDKINHYKFFHSIEQIQKSGILMNDEKYVSNKDYVDYIFDYSKSDVIIIDDFYSLLNKTKYQLDEIVMKIKKKDTHLVLFVNNRWKEKVVKEFEGVITNYIFIDGCNDMKYKDINITISNKTINLRFNKKKQLIMEENNER